MEYMTYASMKDKLQKSIDIQDEDFIQADELMSYFNAAIDEAEAEIHSIYEDYFLSKANISLVSGTEEYTLPSDMYANKIRTVLYNNGDDIYEVKRMKGKKAFLDRAYAQQNGDTGDYGYFIINSSGASNPKLLLVPAAYSSVAGGLTVYYIRNANKMEDDDSICDIPEFYEFVIQFVKCECLAKEGNPGLDREMLRLEQLRKLMIDTLSNMVPDEETLIEADLSFYEEMS